MHWIALQWPLEEAAGGDAALPMREALGWWALEFTPRVVWLDEALLLEVSASVRLWGGRQAMLDRMLESNPAQGKMQLAQAISGISALARLRLRVAGLPLPSGGIGALPLATLTAARPHLDLLARLGCRTWGDVAALPRGPLVRRFGVELRAALDVAWGATPESYRWLELPDVFDQSLELAARVENAQALMWSANRLLTALQIWLRARQLGVLAFELIWDLDLKRLDGRPLPPHQSLIVRTAEPAQSMEHLRRLLAERLAQVQLLAPAVHLRLRSLETAPWLAGSTSFLPEDQRNGDPLHAFLERVSARLGSAQVLSPTMRADHRPECAQEWSEAVGLAAGSASLRARQGRGAGGRISAATGRGVGVKSADMKELKRPKLPSGFSATNEKDRSAYLPDALAPTWLLREPLPLELRDDQPCYRGLLRLLTGPRRIEAGWWGAAMPGQGVPAARDYYIAQNPAAELLWVYRERPSSRHEGREARWFLQGLYS
ncbi:Y-family DNA polymerase [Ottowia thiooxydans]|uniref:Y-family DNA polymerase n=1 Tax=Ottowia thiooxydans TaxID=219182 RepID=UPI0004115340|nr:DNA polymerase Y family protein [Ottowia thiooxydans]